MKKILCTILCLFLCASMLAGCGIARTDTEETVIDSLRGGFFYTPYPKTAGRQERAFLKDRESAVATLVKSIETTADLSDDLNKGLRKYEEKLRGYIAKAKGSSPEDLYILQVVSERLLAYRTALEALSDQASLITKMKTDSRAAEAVLDSYLLETVCALAGLQNEYTGWLASATQAVAGALGRSDSAEPEKVISACVSVYEKSIKLILDKMIFNYERTASIYTYIRSADYYASEHFISEAEETLADISGNKKYEEAWEEAKALEAFLEEIKADRRAPATLKSINASVRQSVFSMTVYAGETVSENPLEKGMLVLEAGKTQSELKYDAALREVRPSFASLVEAESHDARAVTSGSPKALLPVSAETKSMEDETFARKIRRSITIGVIAITQRTIKSRTEGVDAQYDKIIKFLTDQIRDNDSKLTPEQQAEADKLITTELETLLGGRKDEFTGRLLNASASELLDTFENWKDKNKNRDTNKFDFNIKNLLSLLEAFGFAPEEIKVAAAPPVTAVLASSSGTDASETEEESTQTEETKQYDDSGLLEISASYDQIKRIDPGTDNAAIMMLLYGWEDMLDQSGLQKNEKKDKNGAVTEITSTDSSGKPAGWQIRVSGDSVTCNYVYPGNSGKSIEIIRGGTIRDSTASIIRFRDSGSNAESGLAFRNSSPEDPKPGIKYIYSMKDGVKHGINMQRDSEKEFVEIWSEGKISEVFTYYEENLYEEYIYVYSGSRAVRKVKRYYPDGVLRSDYTEIMIRDNDPNSFRLDGDYRSFHENGNIESYIRYKEGVYDGKFENYGEDGKLIESITYAAGVKQGETLRNYTDGTNEYKGAYLNGKMDGVWYKYTNDGKPESEIGYKEGVPDGVYHIYATGSTTSQAIHVIGQHVNGKKTGIWVYGYNNEGYVEKYSYENDVMMWKEVGDSRTYFNADGSVLKTEKIN